MSPQNCLFPVVSGSSQGAPWGRFLHGHRECSISGPKVEVLYVSLPVLTRSWAEGSMEIAKAEESLKAAELCYAQGLDNSSANRAYYAMFQAAQVA